MQTRQPHSSHDAEGIGEIVREFYERHPYPQGAEQAAEQLEPADAGANDDAGRRADYHLRWPHDAFRDDRSVLIAGCGTRQAARHAIRWPRARVVGIDVSETSIRLTQALKEKHDLANLELRHLSVERAGELGERFDQIVCTGVLHHLPDPDAGLAALRTALAPGGAMDLMVYAPYGRAGVYLLQDYCRRIGLSASSADISDLSATLPSLPPSHPLWPLLKDSPDFRYEAGLADALLHPQDRPYSVPEFLAFIARNDLRFGRWLRQAPYLPQCGAPTATPHAARLARLGVEDQYAAIELFRGTMARHSAIVYRGDDPAARDAIRFTGEGWLAYRPIRLPETIFVERRLPPDAIGVVLNRRHTDTDIYLPVTAAEKRLWASIDGARSIRALIANAAQIPAARKFFERLYRYDQIVFDTSEPAS